MPIRLLTPAEAAQFLGVSPRTLGRYRDEGRLEFVRYTTHKILYEEEEIQRFLEAHRCDNLDDLDSMG